MMGPDKETGSAASLLMLWKQRCYDEYDVEFFYSDGNP